MKSTSIAHHHFFNWKFYRKLILIVCYFSWRIEKFLAKINIWKNWNEMLQQQCCARFWHRVEEIISNHFSRLAVQSSMANFLETTPLKFDTIIMMFTSERSSNASGLKLLSDYIRELELEMTFQILKASHANKFKLKSFPSLQLCNHTKFYHPPDSSRGPLN